MERRYNPRVPTDKMIHFSVLTDNKVEEYSGIAKNCNYGGLFLESDKIVPQNTEIIVEFEFKKEPKPVKAKASVRWIREEEPAGMGIQLLEFEKDEQRNFSLWLSDLCRCLGYKNNQDGDIDELIF